MAVHISGNYFTEPFILADTSETTVYTVPTGFVSAFVEQIWCADDAGAARTVTIRAGINGTDYTLLFECPVPANFNIDVEFRPLVLGAGDTIKVTGSAAGIHGFVAGTASVRRT